MKYENSKEDKIEDKKHEAKTKALKKKKKISREEEEEEDDEDEDDNTTEGKIGSSKVKEGREHYKEGKGKDFKLA